MGHITTFGYDNRLRQTRVTQPDPDGGWPLNPPTTTLTFDAVGNLRTLTDPKSNSTTWLPDDLNRVISETNSLGKTRTFAYDKASNLVVMLDREGRHTIYTQDALNRVKTEQWYINSGSTLVRTINYAYNAASELTSASDPDSAFTLVYDGMGRLKTVDNQNTPGVPRVVLTQGYDPRSLRTSLTATIGAIGATPDFANDYQYDNLGRLKGVQQHGQTGGYAVAPKRVTLAYNANHELTSLQRFADLFGDVFVATTAWDYDGLGRLTAVHQLPVVGQTWTHSLGYDAASRLTTFATTGANSVAYGYDNTDQLTSANHTQQVDEAYSFDENGNRTMSGYQTTPNNRLLSDGTYNYLYDHEGNRTRRTRISTGEYITYAWDHRNRLIEANFYTAGNTQTKSLRFQYDVFDRRIGRSLDVTAPFSFTDAAIERYVHDGDHIALVFDGTGALTHRLLHNPEIIDQILADEQFDPIGQCRR